MRELFANPETNRFSGHYVSVWMIRLLLHFMKAEAPPEESRRFGAGIFVFLIFIYLILFVVIFILGIGILSLISLINLFGISPLVVISLRLFAYFIMVLDACFFVFILWAVTCQRIQSDKEQYAHRMLKDSPR